MPTLSPVQKAATAFKAWQANKYRQGHSTPLALRKQAIALTTQYSISLRA